MTLYQHHLTIAENLSETHGDRFRTLIAGIRAALNQNACFKSDVRLALKWLTEAQQILEDAPDGLVRLKIETPE